MSALTQPGSSAPKTFDEEREARIVWWLVLAVLVTLTVVKPLGRIPVVGTLGFTLAAALQLYLPMWRCEKLGLSYAEVGLHTRALGRDLRVVFWLCVVSFPPYIVGHHLYMTELRGWVAELGLSHFATQLPHRVFDPHLPQSAWAWGMGFLWLLEITATHSLGVALPEETFYRGYVQPRLQHRWPPSLRVVGTPIGRAAVITAGCFALGHFLGEWNPMRFGPFFPALVFAWQRNLTGSVVGAVTFHAACNVLGELLFTLYRPS